MEENSVNPLIVSGLERMTEMLRELCQYPPRQGSQSPLTEDAKSPATAPAIRAYLKLC